MDFDNSFTSQQQQMSAVLHSPNVVCKCGSKVFLEASVLKKVSSLVSPTGKETIYPIPVYVCAKCGEIPSEFLDKGNAKAIMGEDEEEKAKNLIS